MAGKVEGKKEEDKVVTVTGVSHKETSINDVRTINKGQIFSQKLLSTKLGLLRYVTVTTTCTSDRSAMYN